MQGPSEGIEDEEDAQAVEGDLETVAELGFDEQIINLVIEAGASMGSTFPQNRQNFCVSKNLCVLTCSHSSKTTPGGSFSMFLACAHPHGQSDSKQRCLLPL